MPFHSPLQLRALVVYTLLVVLSPQRVSQGLLYPPRGLIHTLFASPLNGTVSSSFPHPPPLQRRWQTHFPQLTLRLAQNFSPITYLRQGIEWLSHESKLFTIFGLQSRMYIHRVYTSRDFFLERRCTRCIISYCSLRKTVFFFFILITICQ